MADGGAGDRQVTGPDVVREDRTLVVVADVVGHPAVEVVHHEDLERCAQEVQNDAGHDDLAQRDASRADAFLAMMMPSQRRTAKTTMATGRSVPTWTL